MERTQYQLDEIQNRDRAFRGSLMSVMVYHKNLHRIGTPVSASEKDPEMAVMQESFNSIFKVVTLDETYLSKKIKRHSLAHEGYNSHELVNTEFIFQNGIYSPGSRGHEGEFAGALLTVSDDPKNPGKKILNVGFRGTDVDGGQGMSEFATKAYPDMERYYHNNFLPLEKIVQDYAKNPKNNVSEIDVSGHSLGGAMVHRFMEGLAKDKDLHTINKGSTFGSPGFTKRDAPYSESKAGEIKVLLACAMNDEDKPSKLSSYSSASKMAYSAVKNLKSFDFADTQKLLKNGDERASQRFKGLDVVQYAHEYDNVTKFGYLDKERVGKITYLTDYYKQGDAEKSATVMKSIAYYGVKGYKDGKGMVEVIPGSTYQIPQTDYKALNYLVDTVNDGLVTRQKFIKSIGGALNATFEVTKSFFKGEEGRKIAGAEIDKQVAFESHDSSRYVKNFFIDSANFNRKNQVTEDEMKQYSPAQFNYKNTHTAIYAKLNQNEAKSVIVEATTPKPEGYFKPKSMEALMEKVNVTLNDFNKENEVSQNLRRLQNPARG